MAQARSVALIAATAAASAVVNPLVEIQWDGVNWTDETARVEDVRLSASIYGQAGLPGLGGTTPGRATLTLNNYDNRYSPDNEASPLHERIAAGIYRVPVRVSLSYVCTPAEPPLVQFVGEIESPREWEDASSGRKVSLTCVDTSAPALQHKLSTGLLQRKRADELIAALLAAAGITNTELDHGMAVIPWAWFDDENIWPEVQAVAQADGGLCYANKDGTIRFERMTHWLEGTDHTTPQATVNRANTVRLGDSIAWRDCYNKVIVEYAPRYPGDAEDVYAATDVIELPPGETRREICRLRVPCLSLIAPVQGTDYSALNAGLVDFASFVTVSLVPGETYAQRCTLEMTNSHPHQSAYIVGLKLRGVPALGDESQEEEQESALGLIPGEKAWPLRGNPFIQTREQAVILSQFLRDRLERPRRLWTSHGPAIPWLELGDRVRVSNAPAGLTDRDAYVLSIDQSYRAGSHWTMDLQLLPVDDLFAHDNYFRLGVSEWGDPSDPLFY